MTLTLYTTSSLNNKVTKELQSYKTVTTLEPYEPVSMLNPEFTISYDESVISCNYCYCHEFKRFYYMKVSVTNTKRITLTCNVDPLMSWKDSIYTGTATILRSESIGKPTYVVDTQLPIMQGHSSVTSQLFPNSPFNVDNELPYILMTLGG